MLIPATKASDEADKPQSQQCKLISTVMGAARNTKKQEDEE